MNAEYLVVGKIGSPYGIKGWVKVFSYTDHSMGILDYTPWFLEESNGWKKIQIEESREHGKGIIVKLQGYENPETVKSLAGKNIAILRSQLPKLEKNEYYWDDLKGLTVINHRGDVLGTVSYLIATGSNDVLVVKGEKEHAIPYLLNDVIKEVNLAEKIIHVEWDVI